MSTLESGLAISELTKSYNPPFADLLKQRFPDRIVRLDYREHDNGMPIYLVGQANRVLMIEYLNGDNYREAFAELDLAGNAFTTNDDRAGPNTQHLSVFFPFCDLRGHNKTRKPTANPHEKAIVKAQGITDEVIAKKLKYVAGAETAYFVDAHNPSRSFQHFKNCGLEVVALTTNQLFVDYLHSKNLSTKDLETVVASTDIGDFLDSRDLARRLGVPLIINLKERDGDYVVQDRNLRNGHNPDGKRVIIKDDSISGASTIEETVKNLLEKGVAQIIFYASHRIFVGDYYKKLQKILAHPNITIIVSDTLPLVRRGKSIDIPHSNQDPNKTVGELKVSDWMVEKIRVIVASKHEQILPALESDRLPIEDPYSILKTEYNLDIAPPEDTAVYEEGSIKPF